MKYDFSLDMKTENSLSLIIKNIKHGSIILEFGPGNGRMTKYLKEELNCEIYIVEIDEEAGMQAAKYSSDYFIGDIEEYIWIKKFQGIKFDYIIFADVLEHLYQPKEALDKSLDLLKDDGSVFISIPNIAHNSIIIDLMNNNFNYKEIGLLDNTHIRFFTYNTIIRLFQESNLEIVKQLATYSKVGETEFNNSYNELSPQMIYELKNKEYGEVYQFVFEVKRKENLKEDKEIFIDRIKKVQQHYYTQLFFDLGNGFNEENSILKQINDVKNEIEFCIPENEEIKQIRVDLINTSSVIVIEQISLVVKGEYIKADIVSHNAKYVADNMYIFDTNDPQILIDTNSHQDMQKVIIKYQIFLAEMNLNESESYLSNIFVYKDSQLSKLKLETDKEKEAIGKELSEVYEEIEAISKELNEVYEEKKVISYELIKACEEKEAITNKKNNELLEKDKIILEKEILLNSLINSKSWKITKPLRVGKDLVMRLFNNKNSHKSEIKYQHSNFSYIVSIFRFINLKNVKKALFYISKFGIREFSHILKSKLIKITDNSNYTLLPVIETDMLHHQTHKPYNLCQELSGSFTFPLDSLCRIDILTANYRTITSGIRLKLFDENGNLVRSAIVPGDQIKDCDYTAFSFEPIIDSANKIYRFVLKGLGEPYAAAWYNEEASDNDICIAGEGCINCKIYSSKKYEDSYQIWIEKSEPSKKALELQAKFDFNYRPKISIIVPTYNTPLNFLIDMIESVISQTYANWELCIADGGSRNIELKQKIKEYADKHNNIKYTLLKENMGIVGNTNKAADLATGDYIALLDHDDMLAPNALFEVVSVLNQDTSIDFIYSDEDKISEDGSRRFEPHFKPDWSPDTLRSYNYITHLSVIKAELFNSIGRFRPGYDGSQDYDLILRATEKAEKIFHIPKVLYHWRTSSNSTSENPAAKSYAFEAAKRALKDHLNRVGLKGNVEDGLFISSYKTTFEIANEPLVSIIIPNKDLSDDLSRCINSILNKSTYRNYEIIIVENNSTVKQTFELYEKLKKDKRIRVLEWKNPFNYSAINNYAVGYSNGEVLLFLNNDTEIISEDWIERMLEHAQRKEVGAVGAKLYYPDNTIQHAGVILGIGGVAGHLHKYSSRESFGHVGRLKVVQNLSAVTAACLMMRKEVFCEIQGFDKEFAVAFNDIDMCQKVREKDYLIIWTPYTELYHYESKSRGYEDTEEKRRRFKSEVDLFYRKWGDVLKFTDPYYNPNFTLDKEDFSLRI